MTPVDWDALETDLDAVDRRIPPMGMDYHTTRSCPSTLGQLGCVKSHKVITDPVHVAAHRTYGVVAVWSEDGGPPQVNAKLARRIGSYWLVYLFGHTEVVLIEPVEDP